MNWHIGQKVVCVKTSSMGHTVAGGTYTIDAVTACKCGIAISLVGIGWLPEAKATEFSCCGHYEQGDRSWNITTRFRPLDDLTEQMERIEIEGAPVETELEPEFA